jgi:hypothetical protein
MGEIRIEIRTANCCLSTIGSAASMAGTGGTKKLPLRYPDFGRVTFHSDQPVSTRMARAVSAWALVFVDIWTLQHYSGGSV